MSKFKYTILFFVFVVFVLGFSCRQTSISRHRARQIGMDTLCQIYDKVKLKELKPFELVKTDSTWILKRKGKKNVKYRTFGGIIYVVIDKNNGKVLEMEVFIPEIKY